MQLPPSSARVPALFADAPVSMKAQSRRTGNCPSGGADDACGIQAMAGRFARAADDKIGGSMAGAAPLQPAIPITAAHTPGTLAESAARRRRQLAHAVGIETASQLGWKKNNYTRAELTALGEQLIADHALHGNRIDRAKLLVSLARIARQSDHPFLPHTGGHPPAKDYDELANQASHFLLTEFKNEFAVAHAAAGLHAMRPPTRPAIARELLTHIGLDPDRMVDTGHVAGAAPRDGNERKKAVDLYFNRDKLAPDDIRNMAGRVLTDAEIAGKLAALPDSLDAEFSRRFDAHVRSATDKTLALVDSWLSWIGAKQGPDLGDARVEIHAARLEYFRREVQLTLNNSFVRNGSTRKEIPAQGYIATIHAAGKRHQYFLSTLDGGIHPIPPLMPVSDWIAAHTDIVFGRANTPEENAQRPKSASLRTRVALTALGEGRRADLHAWLAPALRGHHDKTRAARRAQTPSASVVDKLLDFVPFHRMIVAIRNGDRKTALLAGSVDLATFAIPMMGAGFQLAAGAVGTIGLEAAAEGIARAGAAALLRQEMRAGIRTTLRSLGAHPGSYGPLPLDADGMATALRGSHPRLATALERSAARAREAGMLEGWRLADTPPDPAAGGEISALEPVAAHSPDGDTVSLLPYGNDAARAYTRVTASGERTGMVLQADRAGWLHPLLPADTLNRYRINDLDLLRELGVRRPAPDGAISYDGKTYARVIDTYIEIMPDHASTPAAPAWRVVAPDGAQRDIVFHRLCYDRDKAIWRRTDIGELKGGGNGSSVSSLNRSPGERAPAAPPVTPDVVPDVVPATLPVAAPATHRLQAFKQSLLARIADTTPPARINAVRSLLDRVQSDPRGRAILNAMCAYRELTGRTASIVLREGEDAARPRPSLVSAVRGTQWNLDLNALNAGRLDAAVSELAAVYNNMTGILQGADSFAGILRNGGPALGAEEEAAWARWVGEDKGHYPADDPTLFVPSDRQAAVDKLRIQLRIARCHGGIDKGTLIRALRNLPSARMPSLQMDLSHLRLTEIPPLPADVHNLVIYDNPITDWSRLPPNLTSLDAAQTSAAVLDHLPPTLRVLDISDNHLDTIPAHRLPSGRVRLTASFNLLSQIPAGLPDTLQHLTLSDNALTTWPPNLPSGLRVLQVPGNQLERLPANLPPNLETLDLSENLFWRIPDNALPPRLRSLAVIANPNLDTLPRLPETLQTLQLDLCGVTSLPDNLPRGLRELHASELGLTRLPDDLPRGLRTLVLERNQLDRLPANITELAHCDIHLDDNPISADGLPSLPAGQDGPVFHLSFLASEPGQISRTLAQAVKHWLREHEDAIAARWESIGETFENSAAGRRVAVQFLRFLDRLRGTAVYGSGESRADIREWLEELSKPEREPLLKRSLDMCEEAAGSCDDRVTLTWSELRKLRVHDDIRLGRYNNRPGYALQIMRQLFRQKKLQDIAYRKIAASPEHDDVEVYLAYIVRLREPLALSMAPTDMRYFNLSGVDQADLDTALQEVQAAERTDFYKELVVDDTWNTLIKQRLPQRYAQAESKLLEQANAPLQGKISEELRAIGLPPDDEDARRNIHQRVWRQMQFDILEPLTRDYLTNAGVPLPDGAQPGVAAYV